MLCYNRFVTKKYKKRKPTDIIRFVKNKKNNAKAARKYHVTRQYVDQQKNKKR